MSEQIVPTCDGRCCAVFPLSWDVAGPDGIAAWYDPDGDPLVERQFISEMLVPLSQHEATARWLELGLGEMPSELIHSPQPLYTCSHWDTATWLCQTYDSRPALCRDYPYGRSCSFCGWLNGVDYFVAEAHKAWEALA